MRTAAPRLSASRETAEEQPIQAILSSLSQANALRASPRAIVLLAEEASSVLETIGAA